MPGDVPGVIMPPVAMTLMKSAPASAIVRTASTTSSRLSARRPHQCRCPAVVVMGAPHTSRRGPRDVAVVDGVAHVHVERQVAAGVAHVVTPVASPRWPLPMAVTMRSASVAPMWIPRVVG